MRCSDQLVRVGCCFAFCATSVGANAERGALEQSGYSKFRVDITTHSVAAAGVFGTPNDDQVDDVQNESSVPQWEQQ